MKRLCWALVPLALVSLTPPPDAAACGDKFLVIGRSARRVQRARNPASILLLLRADAPLAAAVREMKLAATLEKAGHAVETMNETAPLAEWLATHRYDFILTGLDTAPATVRDTAAGLNAPAVIPLAVNTDAASLRAAEKQYGLVIQAPTRSISFLSVIDAEMGRRRAVSSR